MAEEDGVRVGGRVEPVLGDYGVNLNTSQLSLGIWAGAVALKNLEIKENALVCFDNKHFLMLGSINRLHLGYMNIFLTCHLKLFKFKKTS